MEGNGMGLARETRETDSLASQPHSILQVHVTSRDVLGSPRHLRDKQDLLGGTLQVHGTSRDVPGSPVYMYLRDMQDLGRGSSLQVRGTSRDVPGSPRYLRDMHPPGSYAFLGCPGKS